MIKIYKYDNGHPDLIKVCNDPKLKGKKRDNAIDEVIKHIGIETSIKDYLSDIYRDSFFHKTCLYKCFGQPENCIERLAYSELEYDNELSYCNAKKNFPEDIIENRTSWDKLKEYLDGLYYFIESLKDEVAGGKIICKD